MPQVIALATLLVPFVAGAGLACVLRRIGRWGRAGVVIAMMGAAGIGIALVDPCRIPIGAGDTLSIAIAGSLGLLLMLHGPRARTTDPLLFLASTLFAAGTLEVAVRVLIPRSEIRGSPTYEQDLLYDAATESALTPYSPRSRSIFLTVARACAAIYPEHEGALFAQRTRACRPGEAVVLHVGDSMVEDVPSESTQPPVVFVDHLNERDPGRCHVNAGVAGTGPEIYAAVAHRWSRLLRPERVIVYIFVGNDESGMGLGLPCCEGLSPVAYGETGASLRCLEPRPLSCWLQWLYFSGPPLFSRVFEAESEFLHQVNSAYRTLVANYLFRSHLPATRIQGLVAAIKLIRDDLGAIGTPVQFVVLPLRHDLDAFATGSRADAGTARIRGDLSVAGIPSIDAAIPFLDRVRRGVEIESLFKPMPDCHFSPSGYRFIANWIWEDVLMRKRAEGGTVIRAPLDAPSPRVPTSATHAHRRSEI